MTAVAWVLAAVAVQRLAELALARWNTRRLLQRGAVEVEAGDHPWFLALHGGWLAALALTVPPDTAPDMALLGVYGLLQLGRVWVIASLGPFWTTRIVSLPGAPLVRHGPYRFLRHPNYMVVAAEIAVLPLAFGAWGVAVVFSGLNALVLARRIRIENTALAERRAGV